MNSLVSPPLRTVRYKLLGGSLILLAGSGLAGVTNLVYNVATARLLGPAGFAHTATVYTLLMLMSAITLTFQVVCAKYVAKCESPDEKAGVVAFLRKRAWATGILLGLGFFLISHQLADYLRLPSADLVLLLGLGTIFYIPLGVRRGYIQGLHAFGPLAINFMLEGVVRVGGAFLLIGLGLGVEGAVLASVVAVIVSYFAALPTPKINSGLAGAAQIPFKESLQAIVFFAGQAIINNSDIVLVKHYFRPDEAGFYAAVSLVGRLVNMCAWSVVHTMFPVSAGSASNNREAKPVLTTSLLLVLLILTFLILGLWAVPDFLWRTIFGARFEVGGYGELKLLLVLYALTTGIYALSSVIITYEMSRRIANTSWVQLAFGGSLVLGIGIFHRTLREVIFVQLALMLILLIMVALPLLKREVQQNREPSYPSLQVVRTLSEQEVILNFLQSEFHHPEFAEYQEFRRLVSHPDLESGRENALRRALLFLRRGAMWRELPEDTRWFHVRLTQQDLDRVRFFPRAQWRRVAQGSFYLNDMVECLRDHQRNGPSEDAFFRKLGRLSNSVSDHLLNPTVLLIGVDDRGPLTILDGNHRIAAAMLAQPPAALDSFRFICGLSPEMNRCCWYRTNVNTLSRYLTNLLRHVFHDPESEIGRFQESDS
ncbi:MAG TPA: oligosaccharide flippase family protein [Verrucomicrobiae bacterium]|nr:oligosaccharide flippase family protein [Verrucomicrobiae bacterium]